MNPGEHSIRQYLSRFAEPEAAALIDLPGEFQRVLVVPVYREHPDCLQRILGAGCPDDDTLLIVVANRPDTDSRNDWFTPWLEHSGRPPDWSRNGLQLWREHHHSLLLVDRVLQGPALPADQGVGLARKIGADIACQLITRGQVQSPWIANTDADAMLPQGYFPALQQAAGCAAVVFPYQHVFTDPALGLSTLVYEFSLHHYVEGLRWAGSRYAYHTLGSTQAVHYRHYAAVRGFPRRAAAEDFYLLNKLAKTGAIASLPAPVIRLQARHSDRVPFGTGPAVARIGDSAAPTEQALYHPAAFAYLRVFLDLLQRLAADPEQAPTKALVDDCIRLRGENLDAQQLQDWCATLNWQPILLHLTRQCRTEAERVDHIHHWFDGFRTLKLVNHLRRHVTGSIPFSAWPQQAGLWRQPGNNRMQAICRQIEALTCSGSAARE